MKLILIMGAALSAIIPCYLHAENKPITAKRDARVKQVIYVDSDVIPLTLPLLSTCHVTLAKSETIVSIEAGDPLSWQVHQHKQSPNQFFIKPTAEKSRTNLTVLTNKRPYYFSLTSAPENKVPLVGLTVLPPVAAEAAKKPLAINPKKMQCRYRYHGNAIAAPLQVCDDGNVTLFTFRVHQAIPALYAVKTPAGRETIVNTRIDGNRLLALEVNPQWTLRNGTDVVSLFNPDYIKAVQYGR